MIVAQLRGIRFNRWSPLSDHMAPEVGFAGSAHNILEEVAVWLGFEDDAEQFAPDRYCQALPKLKERIFDGH